MTDLQYALSKVEHWELSMLVTLTSSTEKCHRLNSVDKLMECVREVRKAIEAEVSTASTEPVSVTVRTNPLWHIVKNAIKKW